MRIIGIKLADGSFYPILEEGKPSKKTLCLTTVKDNQEKVLVDLYRSKTGSMEDAEYVDSLQIDNLVRHPNGEANFSLDISLDENNNLSADLVDPETGGTSNSVVTLVSRTLEERLEPTNYEIVKQANESEDEFFEEETFDDIDEIKEDTLQEEVESSEDKNDSSNVVKAAAVGGGLLAAAALLNKKKEEDVEVENVQQDDTFSGDSIPEDFDMISEETEVIEENSEVEDFSIDESDEDIFAEESLDKTIEASNIDNNVDTDFDIEEQNSTESFDSIENEESFDIPDETVIAESDETEVFDLPEQTEDSSTDLDLPDFSEFDEEEKLETSEELENDETFFSAISEEDDDRISSHLVNDNTPSNGINFSGLYDQETVDGDSSSNSDEVKKKTKTPVIICIICAIICVIATLLILFVVPSKYNLLTSKTKTEKTPIVETIIEEPVEIVEEIEEPTVIEAKEDEVVVITETEEVVPEVPVEVEEEKPQEVTYKIKWGDTLWDIADSYYKNPWRYHKIARYNNIKNPDYIISGTTIVLPEK